MTPVPALILVGFLTVTSYRATPEQTDSTPFHTSINHRVHPFGAAVSPDLLASGKVCYGDVIYVEGFGLRMVNDVMNPRHKMRVDLFVPSRDEEKLIGQLHLNVYVMQSPVRACTRKEALNMGMVNAKKLRKAMEEFKKQNGREPSYDDLRNLMRGQHPARAPRHVEGQASNDGAGQRRPGH